MSSACLVSLEEEVQKLAALSQDIIRVEAWERLHQDEADKVKKLEDQLKKLGRLQ